MKSKRLWERAEPTVSFMLLRNPEQMGLGLMVFLLAVAPDCASKHARYGRPMGAPEPPDGEGWYCFHSTSPHAISVCKRDVEACDKSLAQHRADKTKIEEIPEKPLSHSTGSVPPGLLGFAADDNVAVDEPEPQDTPFPPESPDQAVEICQIDPMACPGPRISKQSVPTYSSCEPKTKAFCSPYYHEYNFYRKDDENHWRFLCTETAQSCSAWRELMHLHLVKLPCVEVR